MQHLGVKHKMSTLYYPQTDRQTERLNQTLEQYLQCYVNDRQDNWISLLPLAQIVYNHAPTTTTGMSLFYATYGFQPNNLNRTIEVLAKNLAAAVTAFDLQQIHKDLRLELMFYCQQMTKYANRKRIKGPTLKGGDKVYLLRRNIKSNKPTKKLDIVKLGPFKILRQKGLVNYELELLKKMRILLTFYVSLLELATPDATLEQDVRDISEEIQEPVYEVEKILDSKLEDGQRKYLVK
jgi:hypothetical protein